MTISQLRRNHSRRHKIAVEIVEHLHAFEGDLARALSSGSRLVGFLPEARSDADISAVVGQDAIRQFVSSLRLISKAMDRAVEGHERLDETRQRFRVPVHGGGDKIPIPPVPNTHGGGKAMETVDGDFSGHERIR